MLGAYTCITIVYDVIIGYNNGTNSLKDMSQFMKFWYLTLDLIKTPFNISTNTAHQDQTALVRAA